MLTKVREKCFEKLFAFQSHATTFWILLKYTDIPKQNTFIKVKLEDISEHNQQKIMIQVKWKLSAEQSSICLSINYFNFS
jgi:hypothetical protein